MTALMLQRFMRIPSERVLAEKLAKFRDYRRICGFRRKTPCRGCFTYFRRNRFKEERGLRKPLISWLDMPYP
ncbi:MAG: transposase [Candidatus Bathyarchaeia archaeon]